MSRRSRTKLTFSIELPLPPTMTQAQMLAWLKAQIASDPTALIINFCNEVIIKQTKRETTYL